MVDKMDLALLKQEVVDWHEQANEACDLLREHADVTITVMLRDELKTFEFETIEERRAFKVGVILAQSQFGGLTFEVESDEGIDNE